MFTRSRLILAAAVTALVATGCSSSSDGPDIAAGDRLQAPRASAPARLGADLGARPVALDHAVSVTVSRGELGRSRSPKPTASWSKARFRLDLDRRRGLAPAAQYTLVATASNAAGDDVTRRWSFRTTADVATDLPAVTPLADATVGVGHPVIVYFDEASPTGEASRATCRSRRRDRSRARGAGSTTAASRSARRRSGPGTPRDGQRRPRRGRARRRHLGQDRVIDFTSGGRS